MLAIKQTLYRTSADSPMVPALIAAAERGKQVVVLVELKARFDEGANIRWAKRWSRPASTSSTASRLKTHCKCVLVVRQEDDGIRRYAHIATGNYNPKTARIYADLGLFTCDEDFGDDLTEMFNYLTGYARPRASASAGRPANLQREHPRARSSGDRGAQPGHAGRIRLKMNSLVDASRSRRSTAPRRRA